MVHLTATRCQNRSERSEATQNGQRPVKEALHTQCSEGPSQERPAPSDARWHSPLTCFHPIPAYRSTEVNPASGKRGLVFSSKHPLRLAEGKSMAVPCGKCIGCRLDRSKDWATRCMHEAQLHDQNCFLTLTYDDEHLPADYSVDVRTHQLFMKKLRESAATKLRFFASGEYGDDNLRPHYHYLIFGYRPHDLKLYSRKNNIPLYTSDKISKIWSYGFSTVGNLTYETAAYVARYTVKKIGGPMAADHYTRIHPLSGNLVRVQPEFGKQSNRPGIGYGWFETFKSDVYPSDFVVDQDGNKHAVPKYYHRKLTEEEQTKVKRRRKAISNKHRDDQTPARLRVREEVQLDRAKMLKRNL